MTDPVAAEGPAAPAGSEGSVGKREVEPIHLAVAALVLLVAVLRLAYCSMLPSEAHDLIRMIAWGCVANAQGLSAAGAPMIEAASGLEGVIFADKPYGYPALSLWFFMAVSAVSPSLFAAKLALTLIEGLNSLLFYSVTRSRPLALLYWCSPVSIVWVSREGQFEPLQILGVLLAFVALRRGRAFWAGVALVLAVQVKLTPVLLVPWFLYVCHRSGPRALRAHSLGLVVGLVPTLVALTQYPAISNIVKFAAVVDTTQFYWNPWDGRFNHWGPPLVTAYNQVTTYACLVVLAVLALRRRTLVAVLGALLFVVFLKTGHNVMFWYALMLPIYLLPLYLEGRVRGRWLLPAAFFVEGYAILQGLVGDIDGNSSYMGDATAFTLWGL